MEEKLVTDIALRLSTALGLWFQSEPNSPSFDDTLPGAQHSVPHRSRLVLEGGADADRLLEQLETIRQNAGIGSNQLRFVRIDDDIVVDPHQISLFEKQNGNGTKNKLLDRLAEQSKTAKLDEAFPAHSSYYAARMHSHLTGAGTMPLSDMIGTDPQWEAEQRARSAAQSAEPPPIPGEGTLLDLSEATRRANASQLPTMDTTPPPTLNLGLNPNDPLIEIHPTGDVSATSGLLGEIHPPGEPPNLNVLEEIHPAVEPPPLPVRQPKPAIVKKEIEAEGGRFANLFREGKLFGKKGLLIAGAAAVVGAVVYWPNFKDKNNERDGSSASR